MWPLSISVVNASDFGQVCGQAPMSARGRSSSRLASRYTVGRDEWASPSSRESSPRPPASGRKAAALDGARIRSAESLRPTGSETRRGGSARLSPVDRRRAAWLAAVSESRSTVVRRKGKRRPVSSSRRKASRPDAAAIRLQACMRGCIQRRQVEQLRRGDDPRLAAIVVQACWRGRQGRKRAERWRRLLKAKEARGQNAPSPEAQTRARSKGAALSPLGTGLLPLPVWLDNLPMLLFAAPDIDDIRERRKTGDVRPSDAHALHTVRNGAYYVAAHSDEARERLLCRAWDVLEPSGPSVSHQIDMVAVLAWRPKCGLSVVSAETGPYALSPRGLNESSSSRDIRHVDHVDHRIW